MSGEVQLQFTLADPTNPTSPDVLQRLHSMINITSEEEDDDEDEEISRLDSQDLEEEEDDDADPDPDTSDETDDPAKPGKAEKKRRRKLKLAKLKRKTKARAYEFSGGSDVVGMIFLEVSKVFDLPPERNSKNRHLYQLSAQIVVLTQFNSHENIFRYGSLCSYFTWTKDIQNQSHPSQSEPDIR